MVHKASVTIREQKPKFCLKKYSNIFLCCLISSMKSTFSQSSTVFSFLKLLLGFAELSKVQSSNLLSFLNLLLVCLDFLLKLGCKFRHAVLVLLVFIILELEFLNFAFSLLVCLHVVSSVCLDGSQLNFKFTDARLKLGHGILTPTHGTLIGISKVVLHFSHSSLEAPLGLGKNSDMILFCSKFIGKACSIDHCLLCLLLGVFGLVKHIINLSLHCVKCTFNTSFFSSSSGVDSCHLIDS